MYKPIEFVCYTDSLKDLPSKLMEETSTKTTITFYSIVALEPIVIHDIEFCIIHTTGKSWVSPFSKVEIKAQIDLLYLEY